MSDTCRRDFAVVADYDEELPPIVHYCARIAGHAQPCVCACGAADDDIYSESEALYEVLGMFAMYGILAGTAIRVTIKIVRHILRNRALK